MAWCTAMVFILLKVHLMVCLGKFCFNDFHRGDVCSCTSSCNDYNLWFYISFSIGNIFYKWLIFFSILRYCFCGKSIITICEFNKLYFSLLSKPFDGFDWYNSSLTCKRSNLNLTLQ